MRRWGGTTHPGHFYGIVAQWPGEHPAFNRKRIGSNPIGPTMGWLPSGLRRSSAKGVFRRFESCPSLQGRSLMEEQDASNVLGNSSTLFGPKDLVNYFGIAEWYSNRLLSGRSQVRSLLPEPGLHS
jgi:hypothetical protein